MLRSYLSGLAVIAFFITTGLPSQLQAQTAFEKGKQLKEEEQYRTAKQFFLQAIKEAESKRDKKQEAHAQWQAGLMSYAQKTSEQWDSAMFHYDRALQWAKIHDLQLAGKIASNQGVIYTNRKSYVAAAKKTKEALQYYETARNDTLIGRAAYNLGLTYKKYQVFEKAIETLHLAIRKLEITKQWEKLAGAYQTLGNVHRELSETETSISFHQQGIAMRKSEKSGGIINAGDSLKLAGSFNDLGNTYKADSAYEEALEWYRLSLEIKSKVGNKAKLASTLDNIGEVLLYQEKYKKAEVYLKNSLALWKEAEDQEGIAYASTELAAVYLGLNKLPEAEQLLFNGYEIARSKDLLDVQAFNLKYQLNLYEQLGKFQKALEAAKLQATLQNRILNEEKVKAIQALNIEFEVNLLERELLASQTKGKLLEKEKQDTETINYLLYTISFLFLIIIVAVYRALTRQKKEKQREALQRQEERHRTDNNLQTLIAVFSSQIRESSDPNVKEIAKQAQSKLDAIIILRRMLSEQSQSYPDRKPRIALNTYLQELVGQLHLLHRDLNNPDEIEIDSHPIEISADQAIQVGLIISELSCNAFKHGFKNNPNPRLFIGWKKEGFALKITLHDNGPGFMMPNNLEHIPSSGLKVMNDLAEQLQGDLQLEEEKDGTCWTLVFMPE